MNKKFLNIRSVSLLSLGLVLFAGACGKNSLETNEARPDDQEQINSAEALLPSDSSTPESQLITITRIAKAFVDVYYIAGDPNKARGLTAGDLRFSLDKQFNNAPLPNVTGRGESDRGVELAYMQAKQINAKKLDANSYIVDWQITNNAEQVTKDVRTTVAQEPGRGNWRVTKLEDPLEDASASDENGK